MPKQSPTQREDREQNLLDAAYRLFMSKGQPKTSIDDIVQEAQVAKGSFYTYFKNKDDLTQKLVDAGIRAEDDCRSEKLGYKIREAQMQKIPYMLVVGDRDMENGTVSVRTRKGEDLGAMTMDAFLSKCLAEITSKSKDI